MSEVRVQNEGELWWVRASGVGSAWATASAPTSGVFAFVDSFTHTSGAQIQTISDRGIPNHHKQTMRDPIAVNFTVKWTGHFPTGVSGSGATVPMVNLEYKSTAAEVPSAFWYHFMGCPLNNFQFTENADGNTMQIATNALAMIGPTGSGYIKS